MKRVSGIAIFVFLLGGVAFAQQQGQSSQTVIGFTVASTAGGATGRLQQLGFLSKTTQNAPYSGTQTRETFRVLGDGTRIATKTVTTVYRDSAGRTRTESSDENVTIFDPVAGTTYQLNPKTQTVRTAGLTTSVSSSGGRGGGAQAGGVVQGGGGGRGGGGAQAGASTASEALTVQLRDKIAEELRLLPRTSTSSISSDRGTVTSGVIVSDLSYQMRKSERESLGTQTMEGLLVEGTRVTTTTPEGSIGNDRPINVITERWFSPDLQVYVMVKTTDPLNGDSVEQLSGVHRGEPDATLFQVPANYKTVAGASLTLVPTIKRQQ